MPTPENTTEQPPSSVSTSDDMRRIEEKFADAVARVPADEPLIEGLIKRATTEGLRRFAARRGDDALGQMAKAELHRREL